MLEQIDLFDIAAEIIEQAPEVKTPSNQVFPKWRMLEYLDKLNGKTALVSYKGDSYEYRIPVQFGELTFSSTYCLSNKVNLHSIGPDFEILNYRGTLTKVEKKDNLHLFHFRDKKEGIEIMSKATFELKPYSISRIPNKQSYDETKPLSQLIGYTARVRVKCSYDDVVGKIGSIPFKILSIKETEGEITLIGTNNLYIQSKGFQKVRESGDLLFDVYGEKDGYGRTFHLEI